MGSRKPRVAIFPSAGLGHLIPFAELAIRLSDHHGLSVSFISCKWMFSPRLMASYSERIASSGLDITFVQLPEVEIDGAEHMKIETHISKLLEKSKDSVVSALRSLLDSAPPISAFITDFSCSTMFDVAAELGIPTYVFFTSTASLLSFMLSFPKLVSEIPISFKDTEFPIEIPGLPPIAGTDLPPPVQDRSNEAFYWAVQHCSCLWKVRGILINTFEELEPETIKALVEGKISNTTEADRVPRFYPVGPVISSSPLEYNDKHVEDGRADCLKWLDNQPPSSVLFVSFGSGASLPSAQVTELAVGLEASGHRFLWVLRSLSSSFLSIEETELSQVLPEGFENRTRDRGLVVASWAPQIPVLSHPSTGGFISHCGWNSTLESISHGMPIICWPLFAEQRMNRILLVNKLKVGIAAKMESDGFVGREEVERAVRELMEGGDGRRVRARMRELKVKAVSALEEGGSSYKAMAAAVSEWTTNANAENSVAIIPHI
uniref:Glycosyltransferase n=1 Tax=Picea glauca TaxID=3330 RepID=A0A223PIM8_PICGL|nr:UDP-glycosyltransferase UGT5d [Picea glauca]